MAEAAREAVEPIDPQTVKQARLMARQVGPLRVAAMAILLVIAVLIARFSWSIPLVEDGERTLYDLRAFAAAPAVDQDRRIVMVEFNDQTVARTGHRSPLDRGLLARALSQIDALGPKAIGVDILIDQPQPADAALTAVLRAMRTPTRLGFTTHAATPDLMQPDQEAFLRGFMGKLAGSRTEPASILIQTDADGVVRSWPSRRAGLPPPMAVSLAPPNRAFAAYQGAVAYRRPKFEDRPLYLSFPVDWFDRPRMAAALKAAIAGRYVLVGAHLSSADQLATPSSFITESTISGLELHADLLAQILDGRRMIAPPVWTLWVCAFAAVLAGALTGLLKAQPARNAAIMVVQVLVAGAVPLALQALGVDTQTLPLAGWILGWLLAFIACSAVARSVGAEQRRYAQSALGKYLPRDVATEIIRDPSRLKLQGERREIYAVFTDLQGFTTLSHGLEPEQVATLLNAYLQTLSNTVLEHGGTIDKFVGDAVVAFWGAPIARPDDGRRAGLAAVALWQAGERWRQNPPFGGVTLGPTRVGLHRGDVVVGNFGGEDRFQYTAFGDAMNTAARLESANKQLKTKILVSVDAAGASWSAPFRAMGRVILRGRSTPIEVVEPAPDFPLDAADRLNAAYRRFDAGELAALDDIRAIAAAFPMDAALAGLVKRLESAGPGGSYGLA